jgi:sulfate adenylyltransferase
MDGVRILSVAARLPAPYGSALTDLRVPPERAQELKAASRDLPSLDLEPRELCDLEMLATGAFSPLTGFMGQTDHVRVCSDMRLANGRLWPLPVTLGAPLELAERLSAGAQVALRDAEGTMVALLTVSEIWEPDRRLEAGSIFGSAGDDHPGSAMLLHAPRRAALAGRLEVLELPVHHDFPGLRRTPAQLRETLEQRRIARVLAYRPRDLLHRIHVETTTRLAQLHEANVLLFGAVGRERLDAPVHHPRVRAWRAALARYPQGIAQLNLVELSVRRCGPRAALLDAIVARNFGASHTVVEHDHDDHGPGASFTPRYGQYRAQELVMAHERELGVETVMLRDLVYEEEHPEKILIGRASPGHVPAAGAPAGSARSREVARWFSYPTVLQEWQRPFRGRPEQGLTVFFTGLSGAGKSTIAQILAAKLLELGERHVTLLDGDVVRKHLSAGLSFSREHRDLNVLRLGFVASLITQYRGIAICAPIAPYARTRAEVRAMIEAHGAFIEVYVATPLGVCEARDRKGLYARARAGLIANFTGVSDPYEPPHNPEITINTQNLTAAQAVDMILDHLAARGYLSGRVLQRAVVPAEGWHAANEPVAPRHAGTTPAPGELAQRDGGVGP